MIDGSGTATQAGAGPDGFVDETLGVGDGPRQRSAAGKAGGDGGGIRAARAVGLPGIHAGRGKLAPLRAVEENIRGGAFQMAALDEDRAGAHFEEAAGGA